MRWTYYIPHTWQTPQDRTVWEDIYLMPETDWPEGQDRVSVWLTVEGLGDTPWEGDEEGWSKYWTTVEQLKTSEYIINGQDGEMHVRAEDFNLKEFLNYAKAFIRETFGDHDITLVEGTYEDFLGTNEHTAFLEELANRIVEAEGKKRRDKKKRP